MKTCGIFETREQLERKVISLYTKTHNSVKSIAAMCAISKTTAQRIIDKHYESETKTKTYS